jgi:hypothetical protein
MENVKLFKVKLNYIFKFRVNLLVIFVGVVKNCLLLKMVMVMKGKFIFYIKSVISTLHDVDENDHTFNDEPDAL